MPALRVNNIVLSVTEEDVYEHFNKAARVANVKLTKATKAACGYAYVNYDDSRDADEAMLKLQHSKIRDVECHLTSTDNRVEEAKNIFVRGLSKKTLQSGVDKFFSQFGEVTSCRLKVTPTGESVGSGFVQFASEESARKAVEDGSGMKLDDAVLEIQRFVPHDKREAPMTNLNVSNIPKGMSEPDLRALFTPFGAVDSVLYKSDAAKPYAYINMPAGAADAMAGLNGKDMRATPTGAPSASDKLVVVRALTKQELAARAAKVQPANLFVKNLHTQVDEAELRELFAPYGNITSVAVMTDAAGQSRGFGFVNYATPVEAEKAIACMNFNSVRGKVLSVCVAEPRTVREKRLADRYSSGKGPNLAAAAAAPGLGGLAGMPPSLMGKGLPFPGSVPGGKGAVNMGLLQQQMYAAAIMAQRQPSAATMPSMLPGTMSAGGVSPHLLAAKGMGKGLQPGHPMPPNWTAAAQAQAMAMAHQARTISGDGLPPLSQILMMPSEAQKQLIGSSIYPRALNVSKESAGKLTGNLLELDITELYKLCQEPTKLTRALEDAYVKYQENAGRA